MDHAFYPAGDLLHRIKALENEFMTSEFATLRPSALW